MSNGKSLLDPDIIQCPFPFYEELRKEQPIAFMPELKGFFVSSHALAKQVLTDKRFRKSPLVKDGSKFVPPNKKAMEILLRDEEIGLPVHCLSESDGSRHIQFRKMTESIFGNRAASALEPALQSDADELIDEIGSAETCEFISQFSSPYAIGAVCDIVGMPKSMRNEMRDYAHAANSYRAFVLSDEEGAAVAEILVAMHGVVREMLRDRRKNPKDDLLTTLTQARVDDAPLSEKEMVYIVEEVSMGGYDTTANSLNCGMAYLASHPDLQEAIRRDPGQTTAFVEEALRALPGVQAGHRIADVDVEIGGMLVKANQKVYVGTGAASRDEAQFKCPAQFDHHRNDLNQHIAFGGGKHHCLGAIVTRLEQRVAYDTWLKRFSAIELMHAFDSVIYRNSWVLRSPVEVPLRLRRA